VLSVCRKQKHALKAAGYELADAAQEIYVAILEADSYDPSRGAYSTYVTTIAKRRVTDLIRRANRQCRRLAPELKAAEWEADNVPVDDPQTPDVLTGMSIIEMARYLMQAGRGMQRKPGDHSAYAPVTRAVVALLAGKLSMGSRAIGQMLRDNPELAQALDCWPVPSDSTLQHWLESPHFAAVKGVIQNRKI
jgi:DNA-directed RNA polymerase specialized sigma24 family protein